MIKFKSIFWLALLSASSSFAIYSGLNGSENIVVFNFDGSASMRPLIEALLDKYSTKQTSTVSFNVSAIGSNSGLKKVLNGTSEFALISHDISKLPKSKEYKEIWKTKQLKTIVLAYEAMVILYKTPKSCTSKLSLNQTNIQNFYSLFSGHKLPGQDKSSFNLNDLLETPSAKCNITLYPWVKSTGPIKSGTAKAFVDNPLLNKVCENKSNQEKETCNSWLNKAKTSYGNDTLLNYVPESTNLHWGSFKNNLRNGAITYLPSHFVLQNWDEIMSHDIKLASYKSTQEINWTKDTKVENHEWKRSFNIVYSTKDIDSNKRKKELLEFLVTQSDTLLNLHLSPVNYTLSGSSKKENYIEINLKEPDNTEST